MLPVVLYISSHLRRTVWEVIPMYHIGELEQ